MKGTAEDKTAAWTVLVYMAGDNNLTEEMAWGLQELKKKAAELEAREGLEDKDRINVVAHFDPRGSRSRRYDFAPLSDINRPRPAAAQDGNLHRYEAMIYTRRGAEAESPQPGGEQPADPAQALALQTPLGAFVSEQVARLPRAKRYFLVLSGHGSGAVGDFLTDFDRRTSLSIPELACILGAARKKYAERWKETSGRKIDILGMDSCLMSNAEVCFEIREHADYLVASEGWVANAGWPYHRVLEACLRPRPGAPDPEPAAVAERVAINYSDFYQDYEIAGISTDIAVGKLEAFRAEGKGSLVEGLQAFSRACIGSFDSVFVQDVLARTVSQQGQAQKLAATLAGEIAALLTGDKDEEAKLAQRLADGTALALEALKKAPELGRALSSSQRKAMKEFVESLGEAYGLSDRDLDTQIVERWPALPGLVAPPPSSSVALAAVRLLREFDPSILEALEIIEEEQGKGRPEAKQARAILQQLHQVRWVLELNHLGKTLKNPKGVAADAQLLNAVVASRWRAQSFKGGVYVDLRDLCQCLAERLPEHTVRPLCVDMGKAIGDAVTSRHTGAASQHAQGLSVYFPGHAGDYAPEYDNLQFSKKTGWGCLVRAYLRATRRERRDEANRWASAVDQLVRFGHSEVDPLEADGIEARIVGVIAPPAGDQSPAKPDKKSGTEAKIRSGTESKIRSGTEAKIRSGTEAKIRGEGTLFVWGNPPDGFFRQAGNGNRP